MKDKKIVQEMDFMSKLEMQKEIANLKARNERLVKQRDYVGELEEKRGAYGRKLEAEKKKLIAIAKDLLTWCIEPDKKYIYEQAIQKAEGK